jgi:hypothetical protein
MQILLNSLQGSSMHSANFLVLFLWFFCFYFKDRTPYVVQAGLKFMILVPQPPKHLEFQAFITMPDLLGIFYVHNHTIMNKNGFFLSKLYFLFLALLLWI